MIGIHKGYSGEDKLNYCTMISEEMVAILKKWIMDMKGSLSDINHSDSSNDINVFKSQIASLTAKQEQLRGELIRSK